MPTVCELVVSALVLLSSVAIQTCGQEDHAIPSLPLITFPVLNRCTDNVQSQFVVPETLKYRHYSAQKLNLLTKVINAPLFEFELRLKELPCKIDTFSVTVFIANNGTSCSGKNVFLNFTADGSINRLVISDDNDYLEEIIYHKDNFCISSISKDFISLNFCKSKCYLNDDEAGQNICVPRCCASGSISSGLSKLSHKLMFS
ncbi:unnamed protein product [Allacma fusca]|uniref:Uncharacterized protein n=1 Tax=Allacma fusca TaxID=39272 RepID=A0A8J2KNL9_9HEXA|nr:unnamed protein product [Allacma fusca]